MDNKTYKITLANGKVYEGVTMNGNNYVIDDATAVNVFAVPANLKRVTIEGSDGAVETINNAILDNNSLYNGKTMIVMREMPADALRYAELDARISYLEMMGGNV